MTQEILEAAPGHPQTFTIPNVLTPDGAVEFVRPDGSPWSLVKNALTGQWVHPTRNYDICGHENSSWGNSGDNPAGSPVCLNRAGANTEHLGYGHCARHGGRQITREIPATQIMRTLEARKALTSLAVPVEIDPIDALLHLVHEAAGNVAFLGGRVSEMGYSLVGDVYSVARDGTAVPVAEDAKAMVKLYNEERDRLAKVSKIALDAGIERRQIELLEAQAAAMVAVLRSVVQQLGLEVATQSRALALLAVELRKLSDPAELGDGTPA